jgi:hypothetical protein
VVGQMSEQPSADGTHDETEREEDRGVQLLDDGIRAGKERAGKIEREGGIGVEVVPLDQIADRSDERSPTTGASRRRARAVLPAPSS